MSDAVLSNDLRALWAAVRNDAIAAIDRVGESGWLILGDEVRTFERDLAPVFGVEHAIGTANGLDALEIALRACGLAAGSKVLTTPLSAFATTLAIVRAGCIPVFVDVDASGLLDLAAADARLAHGDIAALLPVHLFGHAHDLARLAELASKHDVVLIEDCAQAIAAKSGGVLVGSVGRMSATSFYPTKNLGCFGDGGAVLTRDASLSTSARGLRDYGQSSKYVHAELGLNSRLDELQAAALRSALLPRLAGFTERRREIAAAYRTGIRNERLTVPPVPNGSESVWHLYPVLAERRDALAAHLRDARVQTGVHYPGLIPDQGALRSVAMESVGDLPVARRFAEEELSLPMHPFLTSDDVARVIDACNTWRA